MKYRFKTTTYLLTATIALLLILSYLAPMLIFEVKG